MKREWTKILGALAIFIALLLTVYWHRSGQEKSAERKEREERLVPVETEKIDRVTLRNREGVVSLARRSGDSLLKLAEEFDPVPDWRVIEPVEALPDVSLIDTLLDDLKRIKTTKLISEEGKGGADYKLEPALVTIEGFEKGKTEPAFTLSLGDLNTASSGVYARTSASPKIVLAEMTLEYLKSRKPSEWRSKEILGLKRRSDIRKLVIESAPKGKRTRVAAERDEDGSWKLTEPERARADGAEIDTLLNEIASLRAEEVISENAAKDAHAHGLDRPEVVIRIVSEGAEGKTTRELIAGAETTRDRVKSFPLRRSDRPEIFSVAAYRKERIAKNFASLVAKDPFDLDGGEVTGVTLERGGITTELWKKEGRWTAARPAGMEPDGEKVSDLISKLISLRARERIGKRRSGGSGSVDLCITLSAGEKQRKVSFFAEGKKDPEAKADPEGLWYRFMRGEYDLLVQRVSNLAMTATASPTATTTPAKD